REPGRVARSRRHDLANVVTRIMELPKPVIGQIGGDCAGAGLALAAACDISVAADDIHLSVTGMHAAVAGPVLVTCLSKLQRADAMELFLNERRVTAQRAQAIRLINRAVPRNTLATTVENIVANLLRVAPEALAAYK